MTRDPEETTGATGELPCLLVLADDDATTRGLLAAVEDLVRSSTVEGPGEVALEAIEAVAPLAMLPWSGPESDAAWHEVVRRAPGVLPLAWVGPESREAFEASDAAKQALGVFVPPVDAETFRLEVRAALVVRRRLLASAESVRCADEELASFLYVVSHDLKAPIQGLLGVAGLLSELEGDRLSADGRKYCDELERNGQRLARMVDALTIISRLGRGGLDRRLVDLNELVEEVFAEIIFQHGERIPRLDHDAALPRLETDPKLLEDIVRRLVDNAVVHHGTGPPRVQVSCEVVRSPQDGVVLTVRDDGPGIPEHLREEIFELFAGPGVQGSAGVGAGLPIVRRAAQLLGGRVWLDSEPGEGSAFHVELPGRVE
ncbi:MAG: sensor histidine kinase [Myxococcota bacterium]